MCFYYSIVKTNATSLVSKKVVTEKQLGLLTDHHFVNGFRFPLMPVITDSSPEAISLFNWGFVPANIRSKEEAGKFIRTYNTLNARGENIFEGRLFGESIKKRRCLVLSSGFFEWMHYQPEGKKKPEKYPFYITLKNEELFVFGGIWNTYSDKESGDKISTYSIVTTGSNELMSVIHNSKKRMPLILSPENALEWLNPSNIESKIESLIRPFESGLMKAHPIQKINPLLPDNDNNAFINTAYNYPEIKEVYNFDKYN
jgi:putative SOS response-associated peptidase YedK